MPNDAIPVPADSLRTLLDLLTAVVREAGQQDKVELVELSERAKAIVEDALRLKTH
ncbi:MAG TPA: hypothetical protein HPP80_08055 [Rhodospirillaceae bacterium]|nr:hypothetical protein [Rhodospirillaceae bacterium]